MLLSPTRSIICCILLSLLVFISSFADAALVRGQGRGGVTVSFGTLDLLVPQAQINQFDMLNWSYFVSMPQSDARFVPPGYPMVQGVPDDCFVPLDGNTPFVDDPCYYRFGVNEANLTFMGSSVAYFPSAIQNMSWRVYAADADVLDPSAALFEFDRTFTKVGPQDIGRSPSHYPLDFSAPMPNNIAAGEYNIVITMEQLAPPGYVFYAADTLFSEEFCTGEPGNELCSRFGTLTGSTFSRFAIERMLVVNEPFTWLMILCFASLLLYRRR